MSNKSKTAVGVLTLLTVALLALLIVSPLGLPAARSTLERTAAQDKRVASVQASSAVAENSLVETVKTFNKSREFGVYYGDVEQLLELFHAVPAVEVKSVYTVDPMNYYSELKLWEATDAPSAVRVDLLTSNVTSALAVLSKMELPVYSLSVTGTGEIAVIFLTGGTV